MERDNEPPQPPASQSQDLEEPIGGEIRVRGGGAPRFLRWLAYILFVWAILYLVIQSLVIHPPVEHRIILWVFTGLLTAWLLFFALTKRPVDP